MEIEKLRRLWYLSTVPTHSKESVEELHELVKELISLIATCHECIWIDEYGRDHCNLCVDNIVNNFELRMEENENQGL